MTVATSDLVLSAILVFNGNTGQHTFRKSNQINVGVSTNIFRGDCVILVVGVNDL